MIMFIKKPPSFCWVLIILVLAFLIGCGKTKAVQLKGSDTMVNLGEAWTEKFMQENPSIAIAVTGGGSGTGIAALINRTTDIAMASREMEEKEIKLANQNGVYPIEIKVANDGIAVVISSKNPVSNLTLQQLSDIFSGKITNWKEIGGEDKSIVALSRDRNSGTHVFFLENVVKMGKKKNPEEFAKGVLMMPSSQAIVEEVSANSSAIGYVGLGYLSQRLKRIAVAKDAKSLFILPNEETVASGSYPIARGLYLYTDRNPRVEVKKIIDFALSKEGQQIVKQMDFVPLVKI